MQQEEAERRKREMKQRRITERSTHALQEFFTPIYHMFLIIRLGALSPALRPAPGSPVAASPSASGEPTRPPPGPPRVGIRQSFRGTSPSGQESPQPQVPIAGHDVRYNLN